MDFILIKRRKSVKKIISEVIQLIIIYVIFTIYGYYNLYEPENKYSWLITAITLMILYPILKLASKKDKSSK